MRVPAIRKNDIVYIRQGKDKGKTGKVLEVYPDTRRVLVEHINTVKAFIKQDRSKNVQGGIMEREAAMPLSRLMLYCAECGQGVRVRMVRHEDGTKTRICPKCETPFEAKK